MRSEKLQCHARALVSPVMNTTEALASPTLTHVCVVKELRPDAGSVGVTAIDKQPVDGPVRVHKLGLRADVQADRAHHGGEAQAVYIYAQEDADRWAEELGRDLPAGVFGENLRTRGITASYLYFGQRLRIGEVELEVTAPRTPCATFQRWLGEEKWVKRFAEVGLTGAYARVISTGSIRAGDSIEVGPAPSHGVSLYDWFTDRTDQRTTALLASYTSGELEFVHREIARQFARISGNPA